MEIKYNLFEMVHTDENPKDCSDEKCNRLIQENDNCFLDTSTGDFYCHSCGVCERYHRKKEEERNLLANIKN